MAQVLQLTDGTTTLNLIDGTNYMVQGGGWMPSVADTTSLSNNYYDQLPETLAINVYGSTPAVTYANVTALMKLLQQAERWAQQLTTESPVRLRYQPQNSGLGAALECLCFGRAQTGQDVNLGVYDMAGVIKLAPVTIKIQRRALWITAAAATATISSNNLATWVPYTATFSGAAPTLSPTSISFALVAPNTYAAIGPQQYMAVAASGDITVISAVSLAGGGNFASFASTAYPAVGTTVLKFTQPAGNAATGATGATWSVPTAAPSNVYDIFLSGRADTTNASIWIWLGTPPTSPTTSLALLGPFTLTASATLGSYYVGRLILPGNGGTTALGLVAQSTNPNFVLIDRIASIRNTAETAIVQTAFDTGGALQLLSGGTIGYTMNALSALLPTVPTTATGTTAIMTRSAATQVLWMASDTSATGGYTVTASTSSGGTKVQATWTLTATRNNAYLTPE